VTLTPNILSVNILAKILGKQKRKYAAKHTEFIVDLHKYEF